MLTCIDTPKSHSFTPPWVLANILEGLISIERTKRERERERERGRGRERERKREGG